MTETGFTPGPGTERALRDALGLFATGVTVVTADSPRGPVGITANSFASVSLEPALVLWSPARASGRFAVFGVAERFAIHVLGREQEDLCRHFTRHGHFPEGLDPVPGPEGVPGLAGCLARLDCRTHAVHEGGDHAIIVGRVMALRTRAGAPLVFHGGRYGGFVAG